MNVRRGLLATCVGAILGMALTFLLLQVFQYYKGRFIFFEYLAPMIGCTSVIAGTAWATYAPRDKHNFAWTLFIVAIVSVLLIAASATAVLPQQRTKDESRYQHFERVLAILIIPPLLTGAFLSWRRVRRLESVL